MDSGDFFYQTKAAVFKFNSVDLDKVLDAVNKQSTTKSASLDGITWYMLKSCKTTICRYFNTYFI